MLALAAVAAAALAPGAFWQDDLSKLTPVPADALARDAQLRAELGAPDVRYLIALRGDDAETRAGDTQWRHRLMSLGHDPLKPVE